MRARNAPSPQAPRRSFAGIATLATGTLAVLLAACGSGTDSASPAVTDPAVIEQGKEIFRFDTFGDERQWTDTLRMHEVIAAAVDPLTALSVGLKVARTRSPPK